MLARLILGDSVGKRIVPAMGYTATLASISAAAMGFLAVFAIALALAAGKLADKWTAELEGAATIRISAPADQLEAQTQAVMSALAQTPGITGSRLVGKEEQRALLAPWFGPDIPLEQLNLPVLIEITETPRGPDIEGLRQRLQGEAPGAVYDTHGRWRAPLIEAANWLRRLGGVSLLLIAGVTSIILALAASVSLAANTQIIGVLRLVGARDSFIIRAFVSRFMGRAFFGALLGVFLATVLLMLMPDGPETGVLSGLGFDGAEWLWPLVLPFLVLGIALCATYVAARRRLREIN